MKVSLLIFAAAVCSGLSPVHAQHAGDILVGMTTDRALAATGVPSRTLFLSAVSSGSFQGWSSTVLGFDAVVETNAANAVNPLAAGASVHLEVVSIDPGLSLRSFTAPAQVFADAPGERLRIGSSGNLHNHPIVFIDRAEVGAGFAGTRTVRFRLVDTGTANHLPSPEYTLVFAPIAARLELSRTGTGLAISFPAHVGLAYQIEAAPEPSGPWTKLGDPVVGNDGTASVAVAPEADRRFIRARVVVDD